LTVGPNLDVGWLQVAMDDALLVRGLECFGNLPGDRQRLIDVNRSMNKPIGERRSLDQLEY
jgi:hypothetical protein